jgi:hypothetical protein
MDRVTREAIRRAVETGLSAQFSSADASALDALSQTLETVVMRAGKRARIVAESCNRSEILPQDIEAAIGEWETYIGTADVLPDLQIPCAVEKDPTTVNLPQFTDAFVNSANLRKSPVSLFPHWLVKEAESLSKAQQISALVSAPSPPPCGLVEEEARGILAAKRSFRL